MSLGYPEWVASQCRPHGGIRLPALLEGAVSTEDQMLDHLQIGYVQAPAPSLRIFSLKSLLYY